MDTRNEANPLGLNPLHLALIVVVGVPAWWLWFVSFDVGLDGKFGSVEFIVLLASMVGFSLPSLVYHFNGDRFGVAFWMIALAPVVSALNFLAGIVVMMFTNGASSAAVIVTAIWLVPLVFFIHASSPVHKKA